MYGWGLKGSAYPNPWSGKNDVDLKKDRSDLVQPFQTPS